jgi:hypothetical protein
VSRRNLIGIPGEKTRIHGEDYLGVFASAMTNEEGERARTSFVMTVSDLGRRISFCSSGEEKLITPMETSARAMQDRAQRPGDENVASCR